MRMSMNEMRVRVTYSPKRSPKVVLRKVVCGLVIAVTVLASPLFALGQSGVVQASPTATTQTQQDSEIFISVDGRVMGFSDDQPPVQRNGRVLVPMRRVFQVLGAMVDWDNASQTATATRNDTTVTMRIGSTTMTVNGNPTILDTPPQIINGSTMIPARAAAEAFGASVTWDAQTNTVIIRTVGGTTPTAPTAQQVAPVSTLQHYEAGGFQIPIVPDSIPRGTRTEARMHNGVRSEVTIETRLGISTPFTPDQSPIQLQDGKIINDPRKINHNRRYGTRNDQELLMLIQYATASMNNPNRIQTLQSPNPTERPHTAVFHDPQHIPTHSLHPDLWLQHIGIPFSHRNYVITQLISPPGITPNPDATRGPTTNNAYSRIDPTLSGNYCGQNAHFIMLQLDILGVENAWVRIQVDGSWYHIRSAPGGQDWGVMKGVTSPTTLHLLFRPCIRD
jgi:hypothetical protein